MRDKLLYTALLLVISSINIIAQVDTIYSKSYSYGISINNNTGDSTIVLNKSGNIVSTKELKEFKYKYGRIEDCKPCYLKTLDQNNKLLSEGLQYQDCGVGIRTEYFPNGKIKYIGHYKENTTTNWADFKCGVRHGKWTFYNEAGKELYAEIWENDSLIKEIPERKYKISDIELYLNEKRVDSLAYSKLISIEQIRNLIIKPKYKNQFRPTELKIELYIYGVYNKYIPIRKEYTISEFKKIDINSILTKAGYSKGDLKGCTLIIIADNKPVKMFFLHIKEKNYSW